MTASFGNANLLNDRPTVCIKRNQAYRQNPEKLCLFFSHWCIEVQNAINYGQ